MHDGSHCSDRKQNPQCLRQNDCADVQILGASCASGAYLFASNYRGAARTCSVRCSREALVRTLHRGSLTSASPFPSAPRHLRRRDPRPRSSIATYGGNPATRAMRLESSGLGGAPSALESVHRTSRPSPSRALGGSGDSGCTERR